MTSTGKPTWIEKGSFPVSRVSLDAIREKNKAHRKWIRAVNGGRSEEEQVRYRKASRKVKSLLRKEKRQFEKGIAADAKTNPKSFWAHSRRKLKTKVGISPLLSNADCRDSLKFDDLEKANILQTQFSGVFTKEPDGDIPRLPRRCRATRLHFTVTKGIVLELINDLNHFR